MPWRRIASTPSSLTDMTEDHQKTLYSLFPTAAAIYRLGRDLTESEIGFIRGLPKTPNQGNLTSEDRNVLAAAELGGINQFVERSLADYFASIYDPSLPSGLQITESWCNYTEQGGYHHRHNHPNSLVSGVFYPQAVSESDRIHFYKTFTSMIRIPPKNWNVWNSDSWWLSVGTGDLLLFPSHLEHMVELIDHPGLRISLSFNSFPTGVISDLPLQSLRISGAGR